MDFDERYLNQKLEEIIGQILDVTSEDSYTKLQQRISRDFANRPEIMITISKTTSEIQEKLQYLLWSSLIKIGPSLNSLLLREKHADDAFRKKVFNRFSIFLDCISPNREDVERFITSYDRTLGRPPYNAVEMLLRDTMIYVHRLAEELLVFFKEENSQDGTEN